MNYYALFFSNEGYVEKCISLIRAISKPQSSSLPHITVRIVKETKSNLDYINNVSVSYLDIVEPGNFGLESKSSTFVVFLRCESDELEEIEYKPNFPFSRLHVTLYEGDNLSYAKDLLSLLSGYKWHFRLSFDSPLKLVKSKIGSKHAMISKDAIAKLYREVTGFGISESSFGDMDEKSRLQFVKCILDRLQAHLESHSSNTSRITSHFSGRPDGFSAQYIDESSHAVRYSDDNQLSFDMQFAVNAQDVNKHVCDAIYVTPPEYARDMAKCAMDAFGTDVQNICFGDSAIGTGALFLALCQWINYINKSKNLKYKFENAFGVDIDKDMAEEAFIRYSKRGLSVIYGDATSPEINLGSFRNLMLVNPPYNRHECIPKEYRNHLACVAKEQTGISVRGDADLFVYHLLIMDKWLGENGVASWLLPSIFLQSRYGEAVRKYLLSNVQLLSLHVYDDIKQQFEGIQISTTIVTFKKCKPSKSLNISVSSGDSAISPTLSLKVNIDDFLKHSSNWRNVLYSTTNSLYTAKCFNLELSFSDLFDIKRGVATGANSFFVLDRLEAERLSIPSSALKPLLPKSKYLQSLTVNSRDDGFPDVSPQLVLIDCDFSEQYIKSNFKSFYSYLQLAKQKDIYGKAIVDRALIRKRRPWYKQETRDTPVFLLTYMGRVKKNLPPLYFILNKSKATALNTYILLYPRPWLHTLLRSNDSLYDELLQALNQSAKVIISNQTRVYAGGLQKLEPGELKSLPVCDLPRIFCQAFLEFSHGINSLL